MRQEGPYTCKGNDYTGVGNARPVYEESPCQDDAGTRHSFVFTLGDGPARAYANLQDYCHHHE